MGRDRRSGASRCQNNPERGHGRDDERDAPQNAGTGLEKRDEVRVHPVVAEPVQRLDVKPPDAHVEPDDAVRV